MNSAAVPATTVTFDSVHQIDLTARKLIAARLLWLLRKSELERSQSKPDVRTRQFLQAFEIAIEICQQDEEEEEAEQPLVGYLGTLAKRLEEATSFLREAPFATAKSKLSDDIALFDCTECGCDVNKKLICNGGVVDRELFGDPKGALCLRFLSTMIEEFASATVERYRTIGGGEVPKTLVPPIVLETYRKRDSDSTLPIDGEFEHVTGHTAAVLRIYWPIDDQLEQAILSLPYLIFHEVFVHAPQGAARQGPRFRVYDYCAFTEGAVDAVAYHILIDEVLVDPERLPPALCKLAFRFSKACQQYYQERMTYEQIYRDRGLRADGIRQARSLGEEHIFEMMRRVACVGKKSNEWAYHAILLLNLHLDDKERRVFFQCIQRLGERHKIEVILFEPFRRFVEDRDATALLDWFRKMCT